MSENKQSMQIIKFLLIVLASTIVAILLHQLQHDPLMTLASKPRSVVVTSGLFPPLALASLVLAFGIMASVFLAIQKRLPGTKLHKGFRFGIALGGMYLVGMLEAYVVYPVALSGEIYTGLVDGSGILLMSLLLGRYLAVDTAEANSQSRPLFPAILIILVIYVVVRYLTYTQLQIESTYATRPVATFIWTAGMGGWIGILYILVGANLYPASPFKQALVFGGLIFGLNWLIFNLFVLLFIQIPLVDLLYRSGFDALAIVLGAYLSSFLSRKI